MGRGAYDTTGVPKSLSRYQAAAFWKGFLRPEAPNNEKLMIRSGF
jgi:hypothetical protein